MDLLAVLLGFFGAVVAFFYNKEGGRFTVGPAGFVILAFLCLTSAVNFYLAYQKGVQLGMQPKLSLIAARTKNARNRPS